MRNVLLVTGLLLALLLPACGGGGGGGGSPSAPSTPPPPVRTVIGQGTFTLVDSATAEAAIGIPDFFVVAFFTTATGTLDVTVNWTFASNDLDIYLLRGQCTPAQVLGFVCGQPFAGSESLTAKPERLNVAGLAAGNYTLVIASNEGNSAESGTFEIALTR